MPRHTLAWPPTETNREGAVVVCAEHWRVDHAKVIKDGRLSPRHTGFGGKSLSYGYVGPRLCDPAVGSYCRLTGAFRDDCGSSSAIFCFAHCAQSAWVLIGETEGDLTLGMLSRGGLKSAATWLQLHLGLARVEISAIERIDFLESSTDRSRISLEGFQFLNWRYIN